MSDAPLPGFDWFDLIRTLASVTTPVIALLALRNWQRQDKAKREAEFLDALVDAAHVYISEMSRPISLAKFVKIAIDSHAPTWENGAKEDKATKGAIAYIQSMGKEDGKRLLESLEVVKPSKTKLTALAAKGQVFKFKGYAAGYNAVTTLTWQYDRIEALAGLISQTSLNWANPEVLKVLAKVIAIDADEVQASVGQSNVALLTFVRETYARLYGAGEPIWKRRANAK